MRAGNLDQAEAVTRHQIAIEFEDKTLCSGWETAEIAEEIIAVDSDVSS